MPIIMEKVGPNVVNIVKNYVMGILEEIPGIKTVVLDSETTSIISLACPKSLMQSKEVFLIESIEHMPEKSLRYMKGVFILRATEENRDILVKMLKDPQFAEYYLYFTNIAYSMSADTLLRDLARADDKCVVKCVQEIYADFCPLSKNVLSLNVPSVMPLYRPKSTWTSVENMLSNRIVEGILSMLLALRANPIILYQRTSEVCSQLAKCVSNKIMNESEHFQGCCGQEPQSILLFLDRREDPLTPLLSQWTYQAMIHELIGGELNRIDIKKFSLHSYASEQTDLVLSVDTDEFFSRNIYAGYGEIAASLKLQVDKLQEKTKQQRIIESIEDMQKILDSYPEYKKESANVYKHVDLMSIIGGEVDRRKLLELSKLEQSMAVTESKDEHYMKLLEIIKDPECDPCDKLRLALIFALRYEGDPLVDRLRIDLSSQKIENVYLLDILIDYGGKAKRKHGLLAKSLGFLYKATRIFKNVQNVFTQFKSLTAETVESLLNGTLKDVDYPSTTGEMLDRKPRDVIVFIVGGSTYQEARELSQLSTTSSIYLASTKVLNSKIFMAELKYSGMLSGQIFPGSLQAQPSSSPIASQFMDMKFN